MDDTPEDRPAAEAPRRPDALRARARAARRRRVERLADRQAGALSRQQVYAAGVTRSQVRAELRAERWQRTGPQSLVTFTGPLPRATELWVAVLEGGPRALLDGEAALEAGGLTGWEPGPRIRVSVPRGARVRRTPSVDVRQTRRWDAADATPAGIPRTRPEVAAVRSLLWARSEKQGALLLTMCVQQGLTTPDRVAEQALRVRRDRRRALLHATVLDLVDGARTLSEAEFRHECRARGLPEPQLNVRRGPDGRYVVDAVWTTWGVVVEIDGAQHAWATHVVADALRHNELTLEHAVVLRLPLLGYRVAPEEFFAQVERALRAVGCPLPDRPGTAAG